MLRSIIHFLLWLISRIMGFLHFPMWLYFQLKPVRRCPPIYDDIFYLPATILAEKIRNQQIKSEHAVGMYIKRAKEVNVVLNAIVEDRFELAMSEALHADEFVQSGGLTVKELELRYPLLGVPVTIKESVSVEGMSFSVGSKINPKKGERDADAVQNLKNAGAIVYLVSATPERCMNWECMNYVTGRTLNPYDTRRTCGGSSGGEAALISSAGSLIGVGSDLVGSGRGPPSFCGIYGFRTSDDLIPKYPHDPSFDHYSFTVCPITRFAIDMPLMIKCMAPPEKIEERHINESVDPKQIRVYYMFSSGSNYPTSKVNSEIVKAMQKVVDHLENDHISTEEINIEYFKDQLDIFFINLFNLDRAYEEFSYRNINIFIEMIKTLLCQPRITLTVLLYPILYRMFELLRNDDVIQRHKKLLSDMKVKLEEVLGDDGILLYPTVPNVANIHGKIYALSHNTCYMGIFSMLDSAVMTIPIGKDKNGLPIGIQVVAKQFNERVPMAFARYMETSYGGWTPPKFSGHLQQI